MTQQAGKKEKFVFTKEEKSWIFQDWANSAFSIMVVTAVFPLFYKAVASNAGVSDADSTAYLGYANSIATASVALMAPVLGAIADYKGFRRPMFTTTTLLGILGTLGIAFMPGGGAVDIAWLALLVLYVLSNIGFSSANVFYDASLMDVTTSSRMSRVSSTGFGMGYIGSSIPFIVFILIYTTGILPVPADWVIRGGFVLTALWWFVFTIPYWRNVEQKTYIERQPHVVKNSFKRLWGTLKRIKEYRNVFLFLLAYFFYIDGVGTIFKMATAVGADVGLSGTSLIIVMLITQVVAFPFSILYGVLSKRFGDKKMIYAGIVTYLFICLYALTLDSLQTFLILALLVGTAQGGIQSLSRSFFGRLIPDKRHNEFFGLYNIFGKFSSILGTTLMGLITQQTGNSLDGVFSLIALFLLGGALLLFVKDPKQHEGDMQEAA
ncbi:MFS transporter [Atopococcus tabaci]|uniref:MFS transporter n=1 Tax=Atopococcus tabaci TaxID=269774 RepID=UPI002409C298|nr:MFS transporter [Atopococcus tabaci]